VILDLKNLHKILEIASKSSLFLSISHPQGKKIGLLDQSYHHNLIFYFHKISTTRQILTLPPSYITGNIDETTTASLTLFFNIET